MNIIIIPHLPTLYGRRYNLAKSLAAQGHTVHFIVWDMPYPLASQGIWQHLRSAHTAAVWQDKAGFTIHKVRRLPFFWPVINGLLFKRQVRAIFNKNHADVIISQSFTNETEPPLDLPLIYDMNDNHAVFADIYGSPIYKLAYKLLGVQRTIARQCRRARIVTVVSDQLAALAMQYNKAVIKIPNGVEEAALATRPIQPQPHAIVYVSTFGKWAYGVEVIELVGRLSADMPDIHIDLIGDGTQIAAMRGRVAALHLEPQVTIHGRINDREKIFELIAKADVCLNVSEKNVFRDSASPMKVIDYSAAGKKIVSTDLAEVQALGFPNVFIYADAAGMEGLEAALRTAFSATIQPSAVQDIIRTQYTWTVLTKKMLNYLETRA